jgi:hypothetical protein
MVEEYARPIDSLNNAQKYVCTCKIVRESKLINQVNFELTGTQIRELWKKLAYVKEPDWDIDFRFGYCPEELPLRIIAHNTKKVNNYARKFSWPILFPETTAQTPQ